MTAPTKPAAGGNNAPGRPAAAEQQPNECTHWDGPNNRHCRAIDGVRRYVTGYRCPLHTPAALAGRPEPQPGPGWPIHREAS